MTMQQWRPSQVRPWRQREWESIDQLFDEMMRRPFLASLTQATEGREWMPAVDMFEKEDRFVVKAELPGMKEADIEVTATDDTLTIKGEKKCESEVKEEDYHRVERSYGRFIRSLRLPSNADTRNINASYDSGVLEVNIPKIAQTPAKKIPVAGKKQESA